MKIQSIRALPGPNVYLYEPVLQARLELEDLTEKESYELPGFVERLLRTLPGLHDHHCAKGVPGGFIERLHGGTYFGHIVEHVCIELCQLVGVGANFGKTLYAGAPGRYDVMVAYKNEAASRLLLHVALELVESLIKDQPYPLQERLAEARRITTDTELGPSSRAIVEAAERRGVPWVRLDDGSTVQLGQGVNRRLIRATESSLTSIVSVTLAGDKSTTKLLLDQASIPVPRGIIVQSREEAMAALEQLEPPFAVKPLDGNQGRGISLRVKTADELALAYDRAAPIAPSVIVEEFFTGRDYRVLVVNGRMVAASERTPAHVVGDGKHRIQALVERENQNPLRGEGHEKPLTRIQIDAGSQRLLERAGWTLESVPPAGERIFLQETANLSTGSTARDVTDEVHPTIACICERAARIIGLDICGIDLITPDISQSLPESGAGVVEVNSAPGIRMHHFPSEGKSRDVAEAIIDMLYPPGRASRIPIVAITGTNGKTTVTRMIAHILQVTGEVVGMTTTDGIYIDGHCVARGDLSGFHSARSVLADPAVEVAVLETARGGIVRRSLGYDWSDVGVLTNIQPDHLGLDGVETLDDLLHIKSLVAERVHRGGTLVLNADDERLASLPDRPRVREVPKQIVFVSLTDDNPVVDRHLAAGGTAYFLRDGWLVEAAGTTEHRMVREEELPITLHGAAKFQTFNALAALAACRALHVSREDAAAALMEFRSGEHNQGRMNIYRVGPGYVIVDYGHNPGAFDALAGLATSWTDRRTTGVFTAPGDRTNEQIADVGQTVARCFDRLIIREDEDLRGRQPGEVAQIICRAAHEVAPEKECRIVLGETLALRVALDEMVEGEVIFFFYEKYTEPCLDVLHAYGAEPTSAIEPRMAEQLA